MPGSGFESPNPPQNLALISLSFGELLDNVANTKPYPEGLTASAILARWGKRDKTRGGGELTTEDKHILTKIPSDPPFTEILEKVLKAPEGTPYDEVRLCVGLNGKSYLFYFDWPEVS